MYGLYCLTLLIKYFLIYYYLIVIWPDVRLLENRLSYTILGVTKQRLCDYTTSDIKFGSFGKQSKVSKLGAGDRFISDE